jgi:purine-cytosine permease-like protein
VTPKGDGRPNESAQDVRPDATAPLFAAKQGSIRAFGRDFKLPRSRALRVLIGVVLILFGFLGFLPVLGFWMIPLGLLVLSFEFAVVRRLRRRLTIWWARRRAARAR